MTDPPPGMIPVHLPKGCHLLLTAREYLAAIHRGKLWRRATANARRENREPPLEAPPPTPHTPQERRPHRNPYNRVAPPQEEFERAPLVKPGGHVVGWPRPCPACGEPMQGRRTSACSDRCRAAKSRCRRVPLLVAEAQAIRASLATALEAVWEAKATLERYGGGLGGADHLARTRTAGKSQSAHGQYTGASACRTAPRPRAAQRPRNGGAPGAPPRPEPRWGPH